MKELEEIGSIEEVLYYLYQCNPTTGDFLYRGQSNIKWDLIPSIHRGKLKRYETVISEAFLLYFLKDSKIKKPHIYTNHSIEFLAMCQHYGVPTRLLDMTNDSLIALFFACESNSNEDGSFIMLKKQDFKRFNFNNFNDTTSDPLVLETQIVNPRLRAQSGCFLVWGKEPLTEDTSETYTLEQYVDHVFKENPIFKFKIAFDNKKRLLYELDKKYGVNRKTVYLNNSFSTNAEKLFKFYKRLADVIINEVIDSEERESDLKLMFNLSGCDNLVSLPVEPPTNLSDIVDYVIAKYGKKYLLEIINQ